MESNEGDEEEGGRTSFSEITQIVEEAIASRIFSGCVVALGAIGKDEPPYHACSYGTVTYESEISITPASLFDVASLTKVIATTPAFMMLYEEEKLRLDDPVAKFIPAFAQEGKDEIEMWHLLTHTSGLKEFYPFYKLGVRSKGEMIEFICNAKQTYPLGTVKYSDLSMIVLGLIIEIVTGEELDVYLRANFFDKMGMANTRYFRGAVAEEQQGNVQEEEKGVCICDNKSVLEEHETGVGDHTTRKNEGAAAINEKGIHMRDLIVPTEFDYHIRRRLLWGEVHDPNAYVLEGVSGHAGLFSCAEDVGKFARMMLNEGFDEGSGRRIFKRETVKLFTTPYPGVGGGRALGWDCKGRIGEKEYSSAGQHFSANSYGHTGFTGTSLWIDPTQGIFVTLLSSALHPHATDAGARIREVRPRIADAVFNIFDSLDEGCAGKGQGLPHSEAQPSNVDVCPPSSENLSHARPSVSVKVHEREKEYGEVPSQDNPSLPPKTALSASSSSLDPKGGNVAAFLSLSEEDQDWITRAGFESEDPEAEELYRAVIADARQLSQAHQPRHDHYLFRPRRAVEKGLQMSSGFLRRCAYRLLSSLPRPFFFRRPL